MRAWWDSVEPWFLFMLAVPFLVAIAAYLRHRWDTRRKVSSGAVLFGFWLTLSGYLEPFLVSAGAASAAAVVWLGHRMAVIDHEGHPLRLSRRFLTYLPWLFKEIAKSAWDVSKIILNPRLPVSPGLLRVKTTQQTSVGVVTYANSITPTPGTISVEVSKDVILVHALTRAGGASLLEGDMGRRVTRFEGAAA